MKSNLIIYIFQGDCLQVGDEFMCFQWRLSQPIRNASLFFDNTIHSQSWMTSQLGCVFVLTLASCLHKRSIAWNLIKVVIGIKLNIGYFLDKGGGAQVISPIGLPRSIEKAPQYSHSLITARFLRLMKCTSSQNHFIFHRKNSSRKEGGKTNISEVTLRPEGFWWQSGRPLGCMYAKV